MDIANYGKLGFAIIGLVKALTIAGVPTKIAPLICMVIGIALFGAMAEFSSLPPLVHGVILGLDAAGLFAVAGKFGGTSDPVTTNQVQNQ